MKKILLGSLTAFLVAYAIVSDIGLVIAVMGNYDRNSTTALAFCAIIGTMTAAALLVDRHYHKDDNPKQQQRRHQQHLDQ